MNTHRSQTTRTAAASVLAAAGLALAGCGTEGPETGTDVEDVTDGEVLESSPAATDGATEGAAEDEGVADGGAGALAYEGEYNQEFYDEATTYVGQQVTLSAEVSETFSPDAFAIAGAVDPLLIVEDGEIPAVDTGQVVQVTGTVQDDFSVTTVEEQLGTDLEDQLFTDFEGEPYIMATSGQIIEQE